MSRGEEQRINRPAARRKNSPVSVERLQGDDGRLHRLEFDDGDGVRSGSIKCAGIQDQRVSFPVLLCVMGVAVADEVELSAGNRLAKETCIVAMDQGDAPAFQEEDPKSLIALLPCRADRQG